MLQASSAARRIRSEHETSNSEQRIEQLRSQIHVGYVAIPPSRATRPVISIVIYSNLLRSYVYHSNTDAAIHVFAYLERHTDIKPSAVIFSNLISVYTNVGDLQDAKEVFAECRAAIAERRGPRPVQ